MNNTAIKTLDCPGRITRFYHWMHCQKRYNEKKKKKNVGVLQHGTLLNLGRASAWQSLVYY